MANLLPAAGNKGKSIISKKESFVPNNTAVIKKSIKQSQFFNDQVQEIKVKIIDIDKTIDNRSKVFRKKIKVKNFLRKKEEQKEKESRLESPQKPNKDRQIKKPSLPQTGFLDGVKQYFGNVLAGLFFTRIEEFMPSILAVVNVVKPIASFLAGVASKLLGALVTFVDWGYKAYDQTRKWVDEKLGDNAVKKFDEFTKAFDTFITGAITLGIAYSQGKGPGMKEPKPTPKPKAALPKSTIRGYDAWAKNFPQQAASDASKRLSKLNAEKLKQSRIKNFSGKVGKGNLALVLAQIFMPQLQDLTSGLYGAAGFGIQKKSDKEVMNEYLQLLERKKKMNSGPLGSFASQAYDLDTEEDFLRREIERRGLTTQSKATGGPVTRGGQIVGGAITRTIRKPKKKRVLKPIPFRKQKTSPGSSVGGEKQIKKLYPDPRDQRKANPFQVLKRASTSFKKIPLIGQVAGFAIDAVLGQKPDPSIVQTFGKNFGIYIENAINQQTDASINDVVKNIQAVAEGGLVRNNKQDVNKYSKNIGYNIATSLSKGVNAQINNIITDISRNLSLKPVTSGGAADGAPDGGPGGDGGGGGVGAAGMLPGDAPPEVKAMLEAIAAGEGSWDSVNPQTSVPGLSKMTIAQARAAALAKRDSIGKGTGAMGKWQQLPEYNGTNTIKQRAELAGLNYEKDLFSPENQTKIARAYLSSVYGGEAKLVKDLKKDPMIAARKLNGVWPSLPGGSQQNQDEAEFKSNYKKAVEKYYKASGKGPESMVKGGKLPSAVPLTSAQGWRWDRMHKGIDLDGGHRQPISSAQDATVVWAGDKGDNYGNSVILRYANGAETRFAHFDSVNVRTGQKIKAGQLLGKQGNTGSSTASHLHFEFYPNGGAMTYEGYGDAFAVKDSYFRYGGNVEPIIPDKPLDKPGSPKLPEVGAGLNKGVYYDPKKNKFFKKGGGLFGLDEEIDVSKGTNIQYRSLANFLGRGTKKNQIKKGPDGQMYYWDGNNWQKLTDPEQLMSFNKPGSAANDFMVSFNLIDKGPISALNKTASMIQDYPSYDPAGGNQIKLLVQPVMVSQVG